MEQLQDLFLDGITTVCHSLSASSDEQIELWNIPETARTVDFLFSKWQF